MSLNFVYYFLSFIYFWTHCITVLVKYQSKNDLLAFWGKDWLFSVWIPPVTYSQSENSKQSSTTISKFDACRLWHEERSKMRWTGYKNLKNILCIQKCVKRKMRLQRGFGPIVNHKIHSRFSKDRCRSIGQIRLKITRNFHCTMLVLIDICPV